MGKRLLAKQATAERGTRLIKHAAHRAAPATILIYLNDDFEDCKTDFPVMRCRLKEKMGDALLFHNAKESGTPDPRTLYTCLAPQNGEKLVLSQRTRERLAA